MKVYIKYLTLSLIVLLTGYVYGQKKDSVKVKKDTFIVNYFYKKSLDTSFVPRSVKVNTSLTGVQLYNPVYEHDIFPVTLGNLGMATKSQVFNPSEDMGFDMGMHNYDDYLFTDDNIRYYQVRSPFTELSTLLGARKEQMIEVKHYQNIKKLINLGLDYRVIGSLSQYSRERVDQSNFRFSGSYFSKNKRFYALGNFITNRIKAQDNGGILSVNGSGAQTLDSMNLNNAQTHVRRTEVNVKLYYLLSDKRKAKSEEKSTDHSPQAMDTIKNKRIEEVGKKIKTFDLGVLSYNFSYSRQFQTYIDKDIKNTKFYTEPFYDTIAAADSIIEKKFINTISWSPSINSKKTGKTLLNLYLNLKNENVEIYNKYDRSRYYVNFLPDAGLTTNRDNRIVLLLNSELAYGDYNKTDYKLNGALEIKFNRKRDTINKIVMSGYVLHKKPDWTRDYYLSNFFRWNNDFKSSTTSGFSFNYLYKKLSIGFRYYMLQDYIYFDETAKPVQADKSFDTYSAYIYKTFIIGKFELINRAVYQQVSEDRYLHLPEFTIYESGLFNFSMLKKALYVQAGVDFWYSSSYYADSYMPAIRSFYLQNKVKLPENISLDPFLNFRIKRANIFVKYQHLNYIFNSQRTYLSPYYPLQDAAFKFGVVWRFYD